jgi:hypothetical protein
MVNIGQLWTCLENWIVSLEKSLYSGLYPGLPAIGKGVMSRYVMILARLS